MADHVSTPEDVIEDEIAQVTQHSTPEDDEDETEDEIAQVTQHSNPEDDDEDVTVTEDEDETEDDIAEFRERSLFIGQEFENVETCRRSVKDIAIALGFSLRTEKSDRNRFIAKCSEEGCPWRIHVAKCTRVPTFRVRTLHADHTCEGVQNLEYQQASVGWVARSVESRIKDNPQYKPTEILHDIHDQHGVAVSYMQAWRGKKRSMAQLHGTYEDGYRLLPSYCEQIRKTNPGSIASVFATGQDMNIFQRLFVSFRASIYGFINACRPFLEIDKAPLKGKYLGTLLCASAVDADDTPYPLAIAIVDTESDENWMWFMSELRKLLLGVNTEKMTMLSKRPKGIVEAVETHFPSAFHGFCLRYVSENFRDTFKNTRWVNIFWNAVYALTPVEFESKITEMVEISAHLKQWFQQFPPELWTVAHFGGVRYGHFSLGVTELLYKWALECHDLPVVQMVEHIRHQLTSWFNERRNIGMSWTSFLVPSAEKRITEAIADSHRYQILRANEVEFEIVSKERTHIVDIRTRTCSCRKWQLYGIPCTHAAAALVSCGQNTQVFAEPCFTVASYRQAYSQVINPIPDRSMWNEQGDEDGDDGGGIGDIIIHAPMIRRPPGRPKKKVVRDEKLKRPKKLVQCGRCRMLGHSKKICTVPP